MAKINIELDTQHDSADLVQAVLLAASGVPTATVEVYETAEAAPAPKPARTTKSKPKAAPAPVVEDEDEDEEDDTEDEAPTTKDAVAAATKLVADGRAKEVRAALNEIGAKKVSDLSDKQVPAFLEALGA